MLIIVLGYISATIIAALYLSYVACVTRGRSERRYEQMSEDV